MTDPGIVKDPAFVEVKTVTASNTLRQSDSTSYSYSTDTTWQKAKEMKLHNIKGTVRIVFNLATENSLYDVEGQIYRNGSAVGTLRSTTSTSYVNFSEDITGWNDGDLVQLYVRTTYAGVSVYNSKLEVYYD